MVVIDPGHGGTDPGAVGCSGTKEKDITLAVSQLVAQLLRTAGVKVVLTRKDDSFISLQRRCDIANSNKAEVFVSIHCDSFFDRSANGTTTYVYKRNTQAEKLGHKIQNNLVKNTGLRNRGVGPANFYVLRKTQMPAVLVELAYISNPKEEQLLKSKEFQRLCAESIVSGILDFLGVESLDKPSNWAKEIWNWGKANKLIDGTRPKDSITREEVVAILHAYHYKNKQGQIK